MQIREAEKGDLSALLTLYLHLHETRVPDMDARVMGVWESIMRDKNHHLIVCVEEGKIVSSCVCVVVPNLTRNARPYALIENVVTHPDFRRKGLASACLARAAEIAKEKNCYKIMLLTGAKDVSTLDFYRKAGFNSSDKTAFIQWL
ncbi:MAG: GNAT family N-acetyltransferase [Clostridia bacterium]|nr:GNAT family N-acetyltransferase [Clostridia bacterium]